MQRKATNVRRKAKQKTVATARSKRNNKATKQRTEYKTAAGKKRYLKRKADGTISDNQSYKRAHGADVKRRSKAEKRPDKTVPAHFDHDDDLPLDGPPPAGIVEDDDALSEQRAANFASGDVAADAIDQSLDVELDEDEDEDDDAEKILGG